MLLEASELDGSHISGTASSELEPAISRKSKAIVTLVFLTAILLTSIFIMLEHSASIPYAVHVQEEPVTTTRWCEGGKSCNLGVRVGEDQDVYVNITTDDPSWIFVILIHNATHVDGYIGAVENVTSLEFEGSPITSIWIIPDQDGNITLEYIVAYSVEVDDLDAWHSSFFHLLLGASIILLYTIAGVRCLQLLARY